MALTITDIEQVTGEIAPVLTGGWIQKVSQPNPLTVVLEIRTPGRTHRLLIACQPETARLHLIHRPLLNPPQPPAFCQFLRARIQGGRIEAVRQQPNDRVVEFDLTTKDGHRRLVCELTGKSSNVLLVDADGLILGDLRRRTDLVGRPYSRRPDRTIRPYQLTQDRFVSRGEDPFPVSASIAAEYQDKETALASQAAKDSRLRTLRSLLKKEQRRIEAWKEDLTKAAKYRDYARYGELLKANLGALRRGQDRITLVDYYDEALSDVTIPLDSAKSAQANMDDYFRKHRKYVRAEQELKPRIAEGERRIEDVRREIDSIERGDWVQPAALPVTPSAAGTENTGPDRSASSRGPFRRFTSADGLPIFVGRNARENDDLTFGLAKSEDLWLHARGTPGSHVVVRLDKGADPPPETLRDAGTLALLYSDLKKSGKGEVIYTKRKWVKKAKGQAPGAVIVTQEKSLYVTLDKKRLEALKMRSGTA